MKNSFLISIISTIIFIGCQKSDVSRDIHTVDQSTKIDTATSVTQKLKPPKKELFPILESKIIFDGEYNKYFYLKFRNDSKFEIVGMELHITPPASSNAQSSPDCFIDLKKEVNIKPKEIFQLKEKYSPKSEISCRFDKTSISITSVVLKNGEFLNFTDFWNPKEEWFVK